MGILDGVVGGLVSAGITSVVSKMLDQHGGVQGLVNQFQEKGLGDIVQSWVGTGANQPIAPTQVQQAFGSDIIQQLAEKSGLSASDLTQKLSEILPDAIDKLTPGGVVPTSAAAA
jgi:uncharacterized protein YidB (DUF937 family)